MPAVKITKPVLAERWGITIEGSYARRAKCAAWIRYRASQYPSYPIGSAWVVEQLDGKPTDSSNTVTLDHHMKTVRAFSKSDQGAAMEAILWASKKYDIPDWEKTPWGGYVPSGTKARYEATLRNLIDDERAR